jgi:hypothetical protein
VTDDSTAVCGVMVSVDDRRTHNNGPSDISAKDADVAILVCVNTLCDAHKTSKSPDKTFLRTHCHH